jgi:hypothetical protein
MENKPKLAGSGATLMSKPQLSNVLVPPPTDRSARKSVQVPLAVIPPNIPSKGLAESGSQVPIKMPVAQWRLPLPYRCLHR